MEDPEIRVQTCSRHYPTLILSYLFNWTYYLQVNPFYIKFSPKLGRYETITSRFKKVIAASYHIFNLIFTLLSTFSFLGSFKSQSAGWFLSLLIFIWLVFNLSICQIIWKKQPSTLSFLNELVSICGKLKLKYSALRKCGILVLAGMLPLLVTCGTLLDFREKLVICLRKSNGTKCRILEFGIEMIYDNIYGACNTSSSGSPSYNFQEYFVGNAYAFFVATGSLLMHLGFGICLAVSFISWFVVNDMVTQIKTQYGLQDLQMVLDLVDQLHQAFTHAAVAFGFLYCQVLLLLIPMYALYIPGVLRAGPWEVLELTLFSGCVILSLLPAADIHAKLRSIAPTIHRWLKGMESGDGIIDKEGLKLRASVTLMNINGDHFGLSGKLFLITYGVAGSTFGLIITYSIIIASMQLNNPFDSVQE